MILGKFYEVCLLVPTSGKWSCDLQWVTTPGKWTSDNLLFGVIMRLQLDNVCKSTHKETLSPVPYVVTAQEI